MRKLMNKKGFSLVELMIVVVIMGILIAVAIPLYGAITKNANNKTCSSNVKTIKENAATYAATYNVNAGSLANLKSMFDDGNMPECPLDNDGDGTDYIVVIAANGAAKVACTHYAASGADEHKPDGAVAAATLTADTGETLLS